MAQNQENSITVDFKATTDFDKIVALLDAKERLLSALLKQFNLEILFKLNKTLGEKLREISI